MGNQLSRPFFSSEVKNLKEKYAFFFNFTTSNPGSQFSIARFYVACFLMLEKRVEEPGFKGNWQNIVSEYVSNILSLREDFLKLVKMLEKKRSSFFLSKSDLFNDAMTLCGGHPEFQGCSPQLLPSLWSDSKLTHFFEILNQVIDERLKSLSFDITINIRDFIDLDSFYERIRICTTTHVPSIMMGFVRMNVSHFYQNTYFPVPNEIKSTGFFTSEHFLKIIQIVGRNASHADLNDDQLRMVQENPNIRLSQGGL